MPERLVLCGGAKANSLASGSTLMLALSGKLQNITLRLEDISRRMIRKFPDMLADLVEIAAYVYCADQATSRGGPTQVAMGADWRRSFRFVIPVRKPERWNQPDLIELMTAALSFLSDDEYAFEFQQAAAPSPFQEYLEFPDRASATFQADEVILFSGGLDSLGGTVEELAENGKSVALVSHRSSPKIFETQKFLVGELKKRFPGMVMHFPVLITRQESLRVQGFTQRSRSFLYAALACVFARVLGRERIRFFENGIVSINLPISEQAVGSRATRTTHPLVLQHLSQLFSTVTGRAFQVQNPFFWQTKSEVIRSIVDRRCGDLICHTISYTRVHDMTKLHPHCGNCSQCIDRRFAVTAAGADRHEPSEMYKVELLTGARIAPLDRTMVESYVRTALELRGMDELAFFGRFGGETARLLRCFPLLAADEVASRVLDLHRRHAQSIAHVLKAAVEEHSSDLLNHSLPATSLLVMAVSPNHSFALTKPTSRPDIVQSWLDDAETGEEQAGFANAGIAALQLAVDPTTNEVVIRDLLRLGAADSNLVQVLGAAHHEDVSGARAPENHQYLTSDKLAEKLKIDEPTVRQRVSRCRAAVREAFRERFRRDPHRHILIENRARKGYRLNPGTRFVAIGEIEQPAPASQKLVGVVTTNTQRR